MVNFFFFTVTNPLARSFKHQFHWLIKFILTYDQIMCACGGSLHSSINSGQDLLNKSYVVFLIQESF